MLIFKHTFKALQDKLNTDIITLRMVDLWNEEIDMYREELPILMPAVFIEFLPTTWNTIGNSSTQHGYTTFKIHVVQNIITDTASVDGNNLPTQADTLLRFDLLQQVHECLQQFATPYFEQLDRVASYLDHNHDGIINDIIEYRTIIRDEVVNTNNQPYNNTIAMPDIEVQPNTVPTPVANNTGGFTIPV